MATPKSEGTSRRSFLKQGTALGLGFGTLAGCTAPDSDQSDTNTELNPRARAFMSMFDLRYPIIQGATGGAAGPELAIAVSTAGALGAMGLTPVAANRISEVVAQVCSATPRAFYVNYILNFPPNSLPQALDAGAPAVQFSWGLPDSETLARVRDSAARLGIQVTSADGAEAALALNPDYLVCQGTEAGGHVQASRRLDEALAEVLGVAGETPVLAAGGLATGHDVRRVVNAGAAGGVLGTRFVATQESLVHPDYRQALVDAQPSDTVLTVCNSNNWPNATHRILRNETFRMWEAAGCPQPGKRPGEEDAVAYAGNGRPVRRYILSEPRPDWTGAVLEGAPYAGEGVDRIQDIPPAGELIARLWNEYNTPVG